MNIEITQEELLVLKPMLQEAVEHIHGDLNAGELSETASRLLNVEHRLLLNLIGKLQLAVIEKGLKERGIEYERQFDVVEAVKGIPLEGKAVAGHADTLLGAKRLRLRIHAAASAWRRDHPGETLSVRTDIIAVNPYGARLCDSYWDAPEGAMFTIQVWRVEK